MYYHIRKMVQLERNMLLRLKCYNNQCNSGCLLLSQVTFILYSMLAFLYGGVVFKQHNLFEYYTKQTGLPISCKIWKLHYKGKGDLFILFEKEK